MPPLKLDRVNIILLSILGILLILSFVFSIPIGIVFLALPAIFIIGFIRYLSLPSNLSPGWKTLFIAILIFPVEICIVGYIFQQLLYHYFGPLGD